MKNFKFTYPVVVALAICVVGSTQARAEAIVTGAEKNTYHRFGMDLKMFVSPDLNVRITAGSWANVEEMAHTPGVTLAIVQSDVYDGFFQVRDSKSISSDVRRDFEKTLKSLRVVMPLYLEEVHFLVREDSPLTYVHEIKDAAIWMDEEKSGSYLTAATIYHDLFGGKPNVVQPFVIDAVNVDDTQNQDEKTKIKRSALLALGNPDFYHRQKGYPKVDVVVLVGGQPLELLQKKDKLPSKGLKLLRFSDVHSTSLGLLGKYKKSTIKSSSYPLLTTKSGDVEALAVQSYLITANFIDKARNDFVRSFSQSLCRNFDTLASKGHSKWKDLTWKPGQRLPAVNASWKYSEYSSVALNECSKKYNQCAPQEIAIGTCK